MLVLTMERNSRIIISERRNGKLVTLCTVTHLVNRGDRTRMGFEAPSEIVINREVVLERILKEENRG